ncbi:MAG: GtrA family protein [Armatimonadetes bacterium]|nr:GtrA family protein [Armatimonadota bacterium]
MVRQFIKFGVVGFISFTIDAGFYLFLTRLLGVFYIYAKVTSFCIAATNSYILNRRWTFRSRNPDRLRQFAQFLVVASTGAGMNAGIMYLLHGRLRIYDLYAFVVAVGVVMFWNFLVNRAWTFRDHTGEREEAALEASSST